MKDVTSLLQTLSENINIKINTLTSLDDLEGITAQLDAVESAASRLEQLKNIIDNIPLV